VKIKNIKKRNNKYLITLIDNTTILTYDDVIIKNNILYKKEIDETLKNKIEKENKYYETYNNVVKQIKTKLRSEQEIKEYLIKQDIEPESIIKKLKEQGLINDKIYLKAYIHDRINFSNDGPNKIKEYLIKQKIDEELIDKELEINKEKTLKKLEKLITKKLNTNTKYSNKMMNIKILNYFSNLGYEKKDILYIIEENKSENNDIIKKEYEKLYKKLSQKYEGEKLKYNIKQKLYQKGFNIDEINKIV